MRVTRSQTMSQRAFSTQEQTKSISPRSDENSTNDQITFTRTIVKKEVSTTVTYSKTTKRHTRADSGIRKTAKRSYAEYNEDIDETDIDTLEEVDEQLPDESELLTDATELSSDAADLSVDTSRSAATPIRKIAKSKQRQKVQRVSMSEANGDEDVDSEDDHYVIRFKINKLKNKYAPLPQYRRTNPKDFAFNFNPLWHKGYKGPTQMQVHNVMIILTKFHKVEDKTEFPLDPYGTISGVDSMVERPGHAPIGITIDNVVKVVFSQSTSNTIATRLHDTLCELFQYDVDGESYIGTVPNYHKMLLCTDEEMMEALHTGGLYKIRSKTLISLLNTVYAANCARSGLDKDWPSYNESGAKDFVPGLLSMDYLNGMKKEDLMDHLLGMNGIGVKSAACILAFNFGMPVFAVDTHVYSMVKQLEWIPEDVNEDNTCMALDHFIPDLYKYSLHQAFWHHRINCDRCSGSTTPKKLCPLEHLMNREHGKRTSRAVKNEEGAEESVIKTTAEKAKKRKLDNREKSKAPIVPFHKMRADKAAEHGYVLVRESIDNDFGVSAIKQHYVSWYLKEKALPTKVVTMEDAVENKWIPAKPVKRESGQSTLTSFVIKKEVIVEEEEEEVVEEE